MRAARRRADPARRPGAASSSAAATTREAGRTIVVHAGASLVDARPPAPAAATADATQFGMRPRVRSGYALKRLDASEGDRRWVLRDLDDGTFLRLSDDDAELFELLDGSRSLVDLIGDAEQRLGADGPARLARLLADLGERGFLAGVATARAPPPRRRKPRCAAVHARARRSFPRVGAGRSSASTARGGWVLFTRPALISIGVLAVAGLGVFGYLVGRPLRDAVRRRRAARPRRRSCSSPGASWSWPCTSCAHGLAMASFGRHVAARRAQAGVHLPVRVRRHLGGVVRAAPAADRDQRRRARCRTSRSAGCSRSRAWCSPPARSATCSSSSPSPPTSARSSTSTRSSTATATTCSSTSLREPGLRAARQASSSRGGCRRGAPSDDSPVLARYSLFGLVWSVAEALLRDRHDAALRADLERYAPGVRRLDRADGTLWVGVLRPVLVIVGRQAVDRALARRGLRPMAVERGRHRRPADRAPAHRSDVPRALPARPGGGVPRGGARRARRGDGARRRARR